MTDSFYILKELYSRQLIIPTNVIVESILTTPLEQHVTNALHEKWMEEYSLDYSKQPAEVKEFARLRRRFGDGESAVMAIAKTWGCTMASDDLSAVRKYSENSGIDLIGSLGILYHAFSESLITDEEANSLLQEMIDKSGYRCPVRHFAKVRDWFERSAGRRLY